MFPIGRVDISLMYQSIPAVPSSRSPPPPQATVGRFPALSAPDFVLPAQPGRGGWGWAQLELTNA